MTHHNHRLPCISIKDEQGERIIFTLPPTPGPEISSVLYFTVPKAGTVLLTNLMSSLAHAAKLSLVYVIGELYQAGILPDKAPLSTSQVILSNGYCYGFPGLPTTFEIPILDKVQSILLVRDPRDMAVSMYFSTLLSHPKPGASADREDRNLLMPRRAEAKEMGIDRFVIAYCGGFYQEILQTYRKIALLPSMKVFRYEDVVYRKMAWAQDICSHYGWTISDEQLEAAVAQVDMFPDKERPDQHIRQVHPGNYKQKLEAKTIHYIEETCAAEMKFFGYAPG